MSLKERDGAASGEKESFVLSLKVGVELKREYPLDMATWNSVVTLTRVASMRCGVRCQIALA